MPPSPSLRRSPGMEPRGDTHRRGRSLECRLSFEQKDDDLALFNEMQNRKDDNFLLQATDDFDDLLTSKPKSFPDIKLGINIPARGESRNLLNAVGDKNDYDWLLTPPETPLFPSLDDEPIPANLLHSSGRDRSRPISISRSSTMERNHRRRGSPSPQHFSPSPRTKIGGPSSAPSSTPIPQRFLSGASPVRTNRGNSTSPKRTAALQSNIRDFSLEAPPNLRTSLADQPASYVRGSSPASRSIGSPSKLGRRSMSPAASRRSISSLPSSGDDDTDSLMTVTECNTGRKRVGGIHGSKPLAFSKKPIKTFSGISAPKRSLDSATRPMDRPQNMFRPLLSSVPSSNLYTGTVSCASVHRKIISSVTTSSNTEGSDQYHDDMASDCATTSYTTHIQEPVFDFVGHDDKMGLEAHNDMPTDTVESTVVCSKCDSRYHPKELAENENVCPECNKREEVSSCLEQSVQVVSEQHGTDGNKSVEKCEEKAESYINMAERGGISMLLLKRSNSAISYDDLSYSRDLTSSMMSSTGHGSISTLSSADLRSTRHADMHTQIKRHLSWRRSDTSSKTQSTLSSLSGSSMQVDRGLGLSARLHEEHYEGILNDMGNNVTGEIPMPPPNNVVVLENEKSCLSIVVNEDPDPCEVNEDHKNGIDVAENVKESGFPESFVAEEYTREESRINDQVERREDPPQCSLSTMSEIEVNDSHPSSPRSQTDLVSKEELDDHSTQMHRDKHVRALSTEASVSECADMLVEVSTVKVDGQKGGRTRSLTLEEATDAILFCNSIIHDLAYKAASIAIEKEKENLEPFQVPRPRITIPERREDIRENTSGRTVITQKARKRRKETDAKPPLNENDNRSDEPVARNVGIPNNDDNMKPLKFESKCNCTIM